MVGRTLGHYEILEPLGAGGMGEVYLGEDTRLGRKVAIKVLPAEFASDPERLARFEQEARAAAALNHPHIAAVYDVGEVEVEDGVTIHFIVQEYLEGEPLRAPLDKGALPVAKALAFGAEVAEALDAAHASGIVHRDLKPENVFITTGGHAKVLDFGLAKLTEAAPTESHMSMSPTMVGTVAGQVMGTAGYMAPEQVEGAEIDGRADLFAFGCVLYEMLAGKRPFAGRSVHQTLDLIVNDEPAPLTDIRRDLPAAAHWIVRKCLAKDRKERYQTAADLAIDVRSLLADVRAGVAAPRGGASAAGQGGGVPIGRAGSHGGGTPTRGTWIVAGIVLLVAGIALGATGWGMFGSAESTPAPVAFSLEYPDETIVEINAQFANLSPDGRMLALGTRDRLLVRYLDDLEWREVDGTVVTPAWTSHAIVNPFFSHNGEWIAYWGGGALLKVRISGGAPEQIAPFPGLHAGGSWAPDDTIVVGNANRGLERVSADGTGTLTPLTGLKPEDDEQNHRWPHALPDGEHVLFTIGTSGESWVGMASLETGEHERLFRGWSPQYVDGYLVYAQLDDLMVVPFDLESMQPTGTPQVAQSGVLSYQWGTTPRALFSTSRAGDLTFVSGAGRIAGTPGRLVLVTRDGTPTPLTSQPGQDPIYPRFTPDGTGVTVSLQSADDDRDIWFVGLADPERDRNSFPMVGNEFTHAHRGDGSFVFSSEDGDQGGGQSLATRMTDGSGQPAPLPITGELLAAPGSFSADDSLLVLNVLRPDTRGDIVVLPMDGGDPVAYGNAEDDERAPVFSSTGLIAFVSDRDGRSEVFVGRYPDAGPFRKVSTNGGGEPVFSADGSELFYRRGTDFYVVDVRTTEPELELGVPQLLFTRPYQQTRVGMANYDVSTDGTRFIMVETVGEAMPRRVNVVLGWFDAVKERLDGQ